MFPVTKDETFQYKLIAQQQQYLERIYQLQNILNQATQVPQKATEASKPASTPNEQTNTSPTQQPVAQNLPIVPPSYSPTLQPHDLQNISSESEDATADELMMQALDAARLENSKQSEFDSEVLSHMILSDVEGLSETEKRALEAELRGIMSGEQPPTETHKKKGHKKKHNKDDV